MWRQSIPHIATENERMLSLPCGSKGLLKHDNWLPSDRKVAPKYHHLPRTIVVSQSLSHPIRVCLSVCLFTSFLSSVATHGPLIGLQSSNLLRVPIVSYYRAALTLIGRKRFRYQMESTEHELTFVGFRLAAIRRRSGEREPDEFSRSFPWRSSGAIISERGRKRGRGEKATDS